MIEDLSELHQVRSQFGPSHFGSSTFGSKSILVEELLASFSAVEPQNHCNERRL